MNSIKTLYICGLLTMMFTGITNAASDDKTSFTDADGQSINCVIKEGVAACKNAGGENVICANSDNGYSCSAN